MTICTTPYTVKSYNYNYDQGSGTSTSPFLEMLYDHFENHSELWELDTTVDNINPALSWTIKPKNGFQFQLTLRRHANSSNRVNVHIDQDMLTTDCWTTVDDNDNGLLLHSGPESIVVIEQLFFQTTNYIGNSAWIIETEDAIFVMNKVNQNRSVCGFHAGRIMSPLMENDPENGLNGLGSIGNQLLFANFEIRTQSNSVSEIISKNGDNQNGNTARRRIKLGYHSNTHATSSIYLAYSTSMNIADRRQMINIIAFREAHSNTNDRRPIGVMKYIHPWIANVTPGVIIEDINSDQRFILNSNSDIPSSPCLAMPWEKDVPVFI